MRITRNWMLAGGTALVLAAGGAGVAVATGGDANGEDTTAAGPGANRATEAALAITHGGTANSVERDGENGATWEVEVTKPDGNTVDVRLDDSYKLVVVEDDEGDQAERSDGIEAGG